jgi:hypothetical protein
MKLLILAGILIFYFANGVQNMAPEKNIKIKLQNNSASIYKLALISFAPGQEGNGTRISTMLPFMIKEYSFPVGTALFFANKEQVNFTMSGKNVYQRGDKPDLLVKEADAGKVFKILK